MKCLLILASLAMLAASSPYKGYEDDSGWRGVSQPGVYIPAILLRGALQPGVHIPLEHQRTISMRYPSMTAGTMPGFALLDDRAAVGDADMMDMEARKRRKGKKHRKKQNKKSRWVQILIDMAKKGGKIVSKQVLEALTEEGMNQIFDVLHNTNNQNSKENADMMNMEAKEGVWAKILKNLDKGDPNASEQTKETKQ